MAGIKTTRVDHGAPGPGGKDTRTGENSQDTSVVNPTRAQRPVSSTKNEFTSNKSMAQYKTRPTTGSK